MTDEATETLSSKASNVALSVRMVSGMMTGVVDSLGKVMGQLSGYQEAVDQVHGSSTTLANEMREMVALAGKVDDILRLIEQIALQTRVLSLNATLESARAGVAGRGFAVVASSVKDLAKQTNDATADIREALTGILASAKRATEHSGLLNTAITTVQTLTHEVVGTLKEQSDVTKAAATYVDEAATGVDSMAAELESSACSFAQPYPTTKEFHDAPDGME